MTPRIRSTVVQLVMECYQYLVLDGAVDFEKRLHSEKDILMGSISYYYQVPIYGTEKGMSVVLIAGLQCGIQLR